MKWFSIIVSILLLCSCSDCIEVTDIKEGDIVFIESQSSQAPYIKFGTLSKWTHCGIVVNTSNGMKVLEASSTVKLTPFATFVGSAKNGNWCVKRPEKAICTPIEYQKYLGQSYDLEFKFNNKKMYCSELVWIIYKENDIELCKPRKVSSYIMTLIPMIRDQMNKRNIDMNQEVVAPVDIYKAL